MTVSPEADVGDNLLAAGFAAVLIFVACIGEHQACIELNQKDCATVIAAFRASLQR